MGDEGREREREGCALYLGAGVGERGRLGGEDEGEGRER